MYTFVQGFQARDDMACLYSSATAKNGNSCSSTPHMTFESREKKKSAQLNENNFIARNRNIRERPPRAASSGSSAHWQIK